MPMTLISTVTVGAGGATQIEFADIPQTGKDLLLKMSIRDTQNYDTGAIQFNSNTSNYNFRILKGLGSSVSRNTQAQNWLEGILNASNFTASTFASTDLYVPNYTNANTKSLSWDAVNENNAAANLSVTGGMTWNNTSAITNIKIIHFVANGLAQHSSASLYIIS